MRSTPRSRGADVPIHQCFFGFIVGDGVLAKHAEVTRFGRPVSPIFFGFTVGDGVLAKHVEVTRCRRPDSPIFFRFYRRGRRPRRPDSPIIFRFYRRGRRPRRPDLQIFFRFFCRGRRPRRPDSPIFFGYSVEDGVLDVPISSIYLSSPLAVPAFVIETLITCKDIRKNSDSFL